MPAAQDARTSEALPTAPSGFALERKDTIYAAPEGLCRRNGWGEIRSSPFQAQTICINRAYENRSRFALQEAEIQQSDWDSQAEREIEICILP